MSEGTGLLVLVVGRLPYHDLAVVNVYKEGAFRPALEKIELPISTFPRTPEIGEWFTLVVA